MKKMTSLYILLCLFISLSAQGASFNLHDRKASREFQKDSWPILFGKKEFRNRDAFKKVVNNLSKRKRNKIKSLIKELDGLIPEKILIPFVYWREIEKSQRNVAKIISYLLLDKVLILRDYADDPSYDKNIEALNTLRSITRIPALETDKIIQTLLPIFMEKGQILSGISENKILIQAIKETDLFTLDLQESLGLRQTYCLDHYGFIKGNKVKLLNYNDTTTSKIDFFNHHAITNGGVLDFKSSLIGMPDNNGGHPSFNEPIFKALKEMVKKSKDSIFVDIFLFGGTIGATLAEYMLDQTLEKLKKNPNFKLVILHDYATHYGLKDEMLPIFKYLEKRRKENQKLENSFFLLQSNIQRHPPGIPFAISNLIPRNANTFDVLKERSSYYESKIDHSKVMVIDANTDNPEAWVGSKNWTDHSGGYYFDNAVHIEGPAAALVQHSYYSDIEAALTTDENETKWFYYQEEGLDNKKYHSKKKQILKSFKVTRKKYSYKGSDTVRLTEADVNGTIKNTRNMLIDMIQKAKHHIYMEQLFLYDPYIVDALIKRKIQQTALDIRILVDHNGNFKMGGLPNSIFLRELKSYGIKIRARNTISVDNTFPDGSSKTYFQENHRKITSIDGKALLTGSSNLNPDTLQGSFREFGVQLFTTSEIKRFETEFLEDWKDPEKVVELDILNFQAILGGHKMSKEFSRLINGVAAMLLRAKDDLEGRD